jgi:hypothetical protein
MADPISASIAAIVTAVGTTTAVVAAGASQLAFALGASAATSFTIGAAAASAFKLAGITALSVAANALFAPSLGAGGAPTDWVSDPDAGVPFIAGRLGVGGNLVYSREFGPDARYLGNVTVYSAAGPVHSMGPFYADGVNITFGSGGVATNGGNIAGNMWLSSQDGLQPQPTALPLPGGLTGQTFTGWTANHKLSGFAADLQVLRQDSKFKTYPAGQPRRWRVIEGIKVYDPRLDSTYPGGDGPCRVDDRSTYVYSTNPILHALQWAIGYYANGKPIAGMADPAGPSVEGIDVAAFVSAANVAEANGWTVGARYSTADDRHQVMLGFLQAGGALYAENAGRISCVTRGAVKTSVMTLSRADTAGPVSIDTMPPRRMVINSLIPKCVLEAHQWEAVDLDPVTVAALEAADGELRRRGKSYPFVTNGVQASQLAALDILDAREPLSGTASFKPYVRDLKPGDAFTWDEPGYLLNGVKCVVMDRSYDPATDRVEITWRSETDGKIAYALGLDPALPAYPGLTPTNPSFVPVPRTEDWTPEGDSIGTPGGPRGPVIRIIGDPGDLTGVTHMLVFHRVTGTTDWTLHGEFPLADFEQEEILGLLPDTDYDVRLLYRNQWGVINPEQEQIFPEIRTGAQVVAEALSAAPGSELAQEIAASVRAVQREAQERLAETAALLASLRAEAAIRADDDSLQQFEIVNVRAEAGNALALAQDIITLDISPNSALVQRFVTTEARVGLPEDEEDEGGSLYARTAFFSISVASLEGVFSAYGMSAEAAFDLGELADEVNDTETGLASRASVEALAIAEANAERATARLLTDLQASLASALSTIQSLQQVTSDENSSSALRIDQTRATVGGLSASVTDIASAVVDLEEATATRIITAEAGAAFAGLSLIARDSNGDLTSDLRFAAQVIAFGPDFDTPRFVIDMEGDSEVYGLNAAGTVKTFQLSLDDGRLRLRRADGTEVFDSDNGGVLVGGLPVLTDLSSQRNDAQLSVPATTWTTLASATVSAVVGAGIKVDFSCFVTGSTSGSGGSIQARIQRGSTTIWEGVVADMSPQFQATIFVNGVATADYALIPGSVNQQVSSFVLDTAPSTGSVTYTLQLFGAVNVSASERQILLSQFRR